MLELSQPKDYLRHRHHQLSFPQNFQLKKICRAKKSCKKQKLEENYKDGIADGLWITWYENGQKTDEGHYKDSKPVGLWTRWYEDGQKKFEGYFKDGKADGLWTEWSEDGKETSEKHFIDGKEQ